MALTTIVLTIVRATDAQESGFGGRDSVVVVMAATDVSCGPACADWLDPVGLRLVADESQVGIEVVPFAIRQFAWEGAGLGTVLSGAVLPSRVGSFLSRPAELGRMFLPSDDQAGAPRVALLSFAAWRRYFAQSKEVVGKALVLGGTPYQIVGVLPAGSEYPPGTEVWTNGLEAELRDPFATVGGLAHLAPGTTIDQLRGRLTQVALQRWPVTSRQAERPSLTAVSVSSQVSGASRSLVRLAVGANAAIAVLLLATLYLVNLGRLLRQEPELSLMAALGASRIQVGVSAALEQGLVGLAGAGVGAATGWSLLALIEPLLRARMGLLVDLRADWMVVGIAGALGALLSLLGAVGGFGGGPRLYRAIVEGNSATTSNAGRRRILTLLTVAQLATTVVLGTSAVTLGMAMSRVRHVDLGFNTNGLAVVSLRQRSALPERPRAHFAAASSVVDLLGGGSVAGESTAWATAAPSMLVGPGEPFVSIEGRETRLTKNCFGAGGCSIPVFISGVLPNFVRVLGLRVVDGRDLSDDDRDGSEPVALVNKRAADLWWPGEPAVGKRFKLGAATSANPWLRVVGVVGNTHPINDAGLTWAARSRGDFSPLYYVPLRQFQSDGVRQPAWAPFLTVALHLEKISPGAKAAVAAAMRSGAPTLEAGPVIPFDEMLLEDWAMVRLRFNLLCVQWIAALGVALSLVSAAGVVLEAVRARRRELGVRMALGASPRSLMYGLVGRLARLAVGAAVVGLLLTVAAVRAFGSIVFGTSNIFLFGVDPLAGRVLLGTSLALVALVVGIAYLAGRPILRMNAVEALRAGQ